jgi:hypothetical protein
VANHDYASELDRRKGKYQNQGDNQGELDNGGTDTVLDPKRSAGVISERWNDFYHNDWITR